MALSNLTTRVLFALVAIPITLAAVYLGDIALSLLLAVAAALAAWEFFRIASSGSYEPLAAVGIPLAAALPLALHAYHIGRFTPPVLTLGAVAVLALLALTIWVRGPQRRPLGAAAATVFGVLYTGGMLSFGYALRYHNYAVGAPAGTALLLYPLTITWISDTGAYVVGRAIGRHKLIPAVSPAKTVEGAVGALALCVLASWLYARFALARYAQLGLSPSSAVLFGAVISAAAQLGDLAESLIKREVGAKDSSRIIPGHGGVLDRIDGMIFALPTAYLLFTLPQFLLPVLR